MSFFIIHTLKCIFAVHNRIQELIGKIFPAKINSPDKISTINCVYSLNSENTFIFYFYTNVFTRCNIYLYTTHCMYIAENSLKKEMTHEWWGVHPKLISCVKRRNGLNQQVKMYWTKHLCEIDGVICQTVQIFLRKGLSAILLYS